MPSSSNDPADAVGARRAARSADVERTARATFDAVCDAARREGAGWSVWEVIADDPDDGEPVLSVLLRWRGRASSRRLTRRLLDEVHALVAASPSHARRSRRGVAQPSSSSSSSSSPV